MQRSLLVGIALLLTAPLGMGSAPLLASGPGDLAAPHLDLPPPDGLLPPPGLGDNDPWVDARGDRMLGDLVMDGHALQWGGERLAGEGGELRFAEARVCMEGGAFCGTVRRVESGPGLAGGPVTSEGTLRIAEGGVIGAMLAESAVGALHIAPGAVGSAAIADGGVGASDIDASQVQLRVAGACAAGDALRSVGANGAVACQAAWSRSGNAATDPFSDFLGTTDAAPLALRVNNARALWLVPGLDGPNVVGGGGSNGVAEARGASFVGGGQRNFLGVSFGVIGGGDGNRLDGSGAYGAVGGGFRNTVTGTTAAVGGGNQNLASGTGASVAGGQQNTASGNTASVLGGYAGTASGTAAAVGGGDQNTASGASATVPGGSLNLAAGDFSLAAGYQARANHAGAFVWADSSSGAFASAAANEFSARATGGVRFVSAVDANGVPTSGVLLAPGSGAWSSLSDRNAKEGVQPVDGRWVLERLAALPVSTWSYKAQGPSVVHMGPMAQDFRAAFGLGEDETRISTVDADGVALAAIQGLHAEVQDLRAENAALRDHNAQLEERLASIEALLGTASR
jgi:hypothetical protein